MSHPTSLWRDRRVPSVLTCPALAGSLALKALIAQFSAVTRLLSALILFVVTGQVGQSADTPIGPGFNGPQGTDTWWSPNDPNAAVGPNHVMVVINGVYRIYNKSGALLQAGHLTALFANANPPPADTVDPNITYDDIAQRFVVEATEYSPNWGASCIAVSDTSDPTQGFTEAQAIALPMSSDGGKLGFNADVYVVWHASTPAVFIQKSSMLDRDTNTLTITYMSPNSGYGRPARMHGATNGAPFYFTSNSGNLIAVTRVNNVLSNTPTFNTYAVAGAVGGFPATPSWRNDTFALTTDNSWWVVATSTTTPTLTQSGSFSPPSGYTIPGAYNSIEIAPNGDVGMTYMMISADTNARPVSMWVAWRATNDPAGTMRPSVRVADSSPLVEGSGRHGDFSSTVCDISTNGATLNTFWACNGYIRPKTGGLTEAVWVQNFGGSVFLPPTITNQPQNVTVGAGSPASFSVTATGAQLFQYQWLKDGAPISAATNNPYSIPATTLAEAGNYAVIITNSVGSVTSVVAVLTVIPAFDGVWINASGGSWTNSSNWSGGVIATGIGKTADFSTLNITVNPTVTLDSAQTIGNLLFADAVPSHNWTISAGNGGSLALNNANNGAPTLTVNNRTASISALINTTQGFIKTGAGTLNLANATNTFTGDVTISGGAIGVAGQTSPGNAPTHSALGNPQAASTITISSGASLQINGGDFLGQAEATPVMSFLVDGGAITNTGFLASLGAITLQNGAVLTGNGGTSGSYQMYSLHGNVTVAGTSPSTISGGTAVNANNGYHLAAPTTFDVADVTGDTNADLNVSGRLIDRNADWSPATGSLTKTGAGTMRVTAANTYTGPTLINAGTLALGVGGSIASSTPITIMPGAAFDVSAPGSFTLNSGRVLNAGRALGPATDYVGNLSSAGTINLNGTFTINGNLTLTGGTVNYDIGPNSPDLITLAGGGRALTLSGVTTIAPTSGYFANGAYTLINGFTNASGTAANLAWGGLPGGGIRGSPVAALNVSMTNVTLTISGGTPAALSWKGSISSAWDIAATANWLNSGTNITFYNLDTVTFSDSPTTTAVTLNTNVYPGSVVFNNTTTSAYTLSGAGGIGGSTGVVKTNGNGTVYMNLTNTYSGGTIIGAGTLSLGNNGSENVSGLGIGPITVNTGGTLKCAPGSSGNHYYIANPIVLNGGAIWVEDGRQHLSNSVVNVGASGGTLYTKWGGKSLWIDSRLTGSGPLTVASTGGGDGGITGVHISNPLNTYSGTITVNSAATPVWVANTYALASAVLNLTANNGLVWDGVTNIILGGLSGSGNITNTGNALIVGANNATTAYSGVLSGAGALTKTGAGTLTLNGNNTYTGDTTVNAGTLQVNGSLAAASAVTVAAAGTLAGRGTVNGVTGVQPGGTLAPGAGAIGTLTIFNALTLSDGSTNIFKVSKNGGKLTNDLVSVDDDLTQGGSLIVTNIGTNALAAGDSFKLFNASGWNGGFANLILPPLSNGLYWKTNTLPTNGTLTVALSTFTLTYAAGTNGAISGLTPQTVNYGASGSAVTAVPNSGFYFVNWSDALGSNPRTDANVTNNLTVMPNFAPLAPPAITNLHMATGRTSFTVTGTGTAGQNYVLLTATNLSSAWVPALTNTTDPNGVFSFTDLDVTNYPQRFYRVRSQH